MSKKSINEYCKTEAVIFTKRVESHEEKDGHIGKK